MKGNTKLNPEALASVGEFKAITAQGKKKPLLNQQEHIALVLKKFDDGESKTDHLTLFRVTDKKALAGKEIAEHTVQGPNWTPPSSVGFVLGGMSSQLRLWLASPLTDDSDGIRQEDDTPAIYAREMMSPVLAGYTPRPPKLTEKYGKTQRKPELVLTPPSSPRYKEVSSEQIQKIMNVENSWGELPLSEAYLTSLPKLSVIDLKKRGLDLNNFSQKLLEELDMEDIEDYDEELVNIVFTPEILLIIKGENLDLEAIKGIYSEFIQYGDEKIDADLFLELHSLLIKYDSEFRGLFTEQGMSIEKIISLYNDEPELFKALASGTLEEYEDVIDGEELSGIYHQNPELFYSIMNDPEGTVKDMGLEEFIESFEQAQKEIRQLDPDNSDLENPYDIVTSKNINEHCPDEFLFKGSSSEEEDSDWGVSCSEGLIYPKEYYPYEYYSEWISSFDLDDINSQLLVLGIQQCLPKLSFDINESSFTISTVLEQLKKILVDHKIFYDLHIAFEDSLCSDNILVSTYTIAYQLEAQLYGLVEYINYQVTGAIGDDFLCN